jgi:hypothetical protein
MHFWLEFKSVIDPDGGFAVESDNREGISETHSSFSMSRKHPTKPCVSSTRGEALETSKGEG